MTTINQLPLVGTVNDADQLVTWATNQGDSRRLPVGTFKSALNSASATLTNKTIRLGDNEVLYIQPATGAVERNVKDKIAEVFSVQDFGAVGDGVTDCGPAFQAAFNAANAAGGVVFIPPGRYRKADTINGQWTMYSNTTLRGVGDASVIFWDDTDAVGRINNDMLACNNATDVAFENFKIEGTALIYTNETNQKQCLTGNNIVGLRIVNVTMEKLRYMATAFTNSKNIYMAGNRLDYIVRDGLRATNSENVVITGNVLRRVADDAVALHALDASTPPSSGMIVSNNTFEACQGIKVLGAKTLTISGNVFRRTIRNPIDVRLPGSSVEGNTPQFAITICDNTITDTFGNLGTNFNIRISQLLARSAGGLGTLPGVNSAPYAYNYLNNLDSGTPVIVGQWGIRIANNTIARTLPTVAAYSDWGYGDLFDRVTVGFISDPAVTSASFQAHGIDFTGPASAVQIAGNHFSGLGTTFAGILLQITGTANVQDFASMTVQNNVFFDCPGSGIRCAATGSGTGAKQVVVQNNTFDLDPYFRASNHNADNTWSSTTGVVGIDVANTIGWLASGNVFKNCAQPGVPGSVTTEAQPNIVYADFVAAGDDAGNKGVRQLPSAAMNIIVPINGDPTSSTFGQIANAINTRSASIPTAGRYVAGHRVWRDTPVVTGGGGSQYVVTGWVRLTTGSGHVLNTDWVELRTLTGT
jgi:hypothetical protein